MKSLENQPSSRGLPWVAYNLMFFMTCVVGLPWLGVQAMAVPKHRHVFRQRLGFFPRNPIDPARNRPIWIHALSVGEVLSAIALVKAVKDRYPDRPIVFSAATATGYETAIRSLNETVAAVVHFPYDLIFSVKRVFRDLRPACIVLVETDIWPNFLWEARRRHIPVFLANARLSDRTFSRFYEMRCLVGPLFSIFTGIFTQSVIDARRFRTLGVARRIVHVTGNLKFDPPMNGSSTPATITEWVDRHRAAGRFIWVAGSTHEGEEPILSDALERLAAGTTAVSLLIAPRDPARSQRVMEIFQHAGFTAQRFTSRPAACPPPEPEPQVLVVDTIGLLKGLYPLSDVAFVGGSLVPFGGHNPLEPAAHAKPILFGPHMESFRDMAAALLRTQGARVTTTAAEMAETIIRLLVTDRDQAQAMGRRAYRYYSANHGAVHRTLSWMDIMWRERVTETPSRVP